ncbi:hypothetical protein Tco_0425689 [Tanacetum coccineum]
MLPLHPEGRIVETGKVIYTVDTNIVKLVVEIESFGMSSDEFDKETGSSDGLQSKQADLNCVHALNELHLHETRVVPNARFPKAVLPHYFPVPYFWSLSDDFGKRFTLQQELSAEQAFLLRMSNPTNKPSDASPVKIKAPKELPKVSLVNESLKKLKFHLARFDNVVKIRTTPDARTIR